MNAEATREHANLLRVDLALEDSRAYWENRRPNLPASRAETTAFEERWFGNRSLPNIRRMLADFRRRYDAFPMALSVLSRWEPPNPHVRRNIGHWHLQLADPIYRDFTGIFLETRRLHPEPRVNREVTARWVRERTGDRWAVATTNKMAQNLIKSAARAGLCAETSAPERSLTYPVVPDESLAYLLHLLRHVEFTGTLLANPYLASVGLTGGALEKRLKRLDGLSFGRMGDLTTFEWRYPDLKSWAEGTLPLKPEATA